jgi:type I restriction enzyme R subunit
VVDKLLTGFDAPRNVVLYIARSLSGHTLLQAIARVNRLHPGKDYGYILDYYGVVTELHEALELYSSLEEKFDAEDLEGTLTNIAEEIKKLPALHDALWDLFKEVKNKKDEESFEVALGDKDKREDFYTRLWSFCRVLKMASSSIHWVTETPAEKVQRYKADAAFFQKLRASVKLRYAEEIDYRDYEKQIQKMLNTYVQADEVIQVVEPVNIFEREAFEAEVDKAKSPRAKADTIANRTKKTITEKMEEDPFFYRKLSALLQQAIDDYKAERISEAEYLAKVTDIMEEVRGGNSQNVPDVLKQNDLSRALYGALKEQITPKAGTSGDDAGGVLREDSPAYGSEAQRPAPPADEILAEAAVSMDQIIRKHAVVRWRENIDAQNRMRNDLDDFLFDLQKEKGFTLSYAQMDAIIEAVIRIAMHRTDDV